eukprot:TRINITY_DN30122_c0_g1_i1.p1 TRINITY_DN30122_c0_g1~~TRINITY_DN30122_c0_g1_i1.p1  ORF type:complete len:567 (-),score=40.88 TRINITY_DN30122_c0_g1_i1:118-1680(-)
MATQDDSSVSFDSSSSSSSHGSRSGRRPRGRRGQHYPRYVQCPSAAAAPRVRLADGFLSVFAASIARRYNWGAVLRAALLLDDPAAWEAHLPSTHASRPSAPFGERIRGMDYATAAVQSGISREDFDSPISRDERLGRYAKCFGRPLSADLRIGCRVGPSGGARPPFANSSWSDGRVLQVSNGELQHEFVVCPVDAPAYRWRVEGPPGRLHVDIGIFDDNQGTAAVLPLELCLVRRPMYQSSICTMPLYGVGEVLKTQPWAFDDWLSYHLRIAGFEHAEIYDVDGSVAPALESVTRGDHGWSVSYHGEFPSKLSQTMAAMSKKFPSCTETWAYAHCLTTHRALSQFVVILHSFDEYLVSRNNTGPGGVAAFLRDMKGRLRANSTSPHPEIMTVSLLQAVSMAYGGPGATDSPSERGNVLSSSRRQDEKLYRFTPVLDPGACICAGPHMCYKPGIMPPGLDQVAVINPDHLVVYHYVEMLERDRGRCSRLRDQLTGRVTGCNIPDDSMVWAARTLRYMDRT